MIMLLCLLFFGLFQVSQLYMAKEMVDFAAARGARAKAVGFNDFMLYKTVRVATIPNAGLMTSPQSPNNPYQQADIEQSRVPLYLGAEYPGRLSPILDYEDWDTVSRPRYYRNGYPPLIDLRVAQDYPLRSPFHRTFYAADEVSLNGHAVFDSHYDLYLDGP
ncbi:MAG: hypothetical protein JXR37_03115 [Kiritimatiellae bacterium]|nr:hypothetical protein [Kiritimatiellia bacterium]